MYPSTRIGRLHHSLLLQSLIVKEVGFSNGADKAHYMLMCMILIWKHHSPLRNSQVSKWSWLNSCVNQIHFKTADQVRQFLQVHHFYTCLHNQMKVTGQGSYSLSLLIIVLIAVL